ncbi:MAG: mechanosensitive ion channel [Planctomycetota bacterium]
MPLLRSPLALLLLLLAGPLLAQGPEAEKPQPPTPQVATEEGVRLDVLRVFLKSTPKADIEEIAKVWFERVRAKAVEVSGQQALALTESGADQDTATKEAIKLREERAALVQRLEVVLDALDAKGGDSGEMRRYLGAVSDTGLADADITDVSAVWTTIRAWVTSREGGIKWGMNIVKFIVILIVFRILSRIVARIIRTTVNRVKGASSLLKDFAVRATRSTVMFIGLIVALGAIEIPIGPFVAAIGAAGLVIGLALQGTLSNFAAGILILVYRPFDVGDVVNVAGTAGKVKAMNIFSTILSTPDNQVVMVPNGSVWGGTITNVTGSDTRRVDMKFGIGYGDDIDRAKKVLIEILEKDERILKDPAPQVEVVELADSSVNFVVRPWVKTADYWGVYFGITAEVKRRLDAEGISIPFPQRDVHIHQAGE